MILPFLLFICLVSNVFAQWNDWTDAGAVRKLLLKAQEEKKTYFSQFHLYDVRNDKNIYTSKYKDRTNEELFVYGLDFYYASGTYFDSTYKAINRKNIINVVKEKWKENKAIPSFSWHLENPYVPSDFGDYMGCRYRSDAKILNYPNNHQYVVREILNGSKGVCGFGRYKGKDDYSSAYESPMSWFDDRTREVASIINEFVDDDGNPIPIIFRLWHEQENNWMWWGRTYVTDNDYKEFFRETERKIKKYAPRAQILWGYGPDSYWNSEAEFMSWYPGDEFVDIIGYDDYQISNEKMLARELELARIVSAVARKHGKIAALFETANKNKRTADYFYKMCLMPILQDSLVNIGLVQIWISGKFENELQYQDRLNFINQDFILKVAQ